MKEVTASVCCRLPTRGYTFATWLRVDDVLLADATAGRSLFTLLWRSTSGDNAARGVSAALKGELAHDQCQFMVGSGFFKDQCRQQSLLHM